MFQASLTGGDEGGEIGRYPSRLSHADVADHPCQPSQRLSKPLAHPERLRSEAAWAHLCAAAPIPASSGKTVRHRHGPGGDRQANHALWRIVFTRIGSHPATRAYVERRTGEGKSRPAWWLKRGTSAPVGVPISAMFVAAAPPAEVNWPPM